MQDQPLASISAASGEDKRLQVWSVGGKIPDFSKPEII
jgi:hypothetical protein